MGRIINHYVYIWAHNIPPKNHQYLSAKAMKDKRNLLSAKSFSRGWLKSVDMVAFWLIDPLPGIPRAWPIVGNSRSRLLKLIWDSKGWETDIEKKSSTIILAWKQNSKTSFWTDWISLEKIMVLKQIKCHFNDKRAEHFLIYYNNFKFFMYINNNQI